MNFVLIGAAFLVVFLAAAHSFLGERYILIRLFRRDDLPHLFGSDWFTRRTLRFAWHLTSVAWLGFAAVLVLFAGNGAASRAAILSSISATFAVSALITAAASRGKHFAWVVFGAIAVLVWLAR